MKNKDELDDPVGTPVPDPVETKSSGAKRKAAPRVAEPAARTSCGPRSEYELKKEHRHGGRLRQPGEAVSLNAGQAARLKKQGVIF